MQQEIFAIQKRPEAWGLVLPFLSHADQNVQFMGAHTIQVKIARDWYVCTPQCGLEVGLNILQDVVSLRKRHTAPGSAGRCDRALHIRWAEQTDPA